MNRFVFMTSLCFGLTAVSVFEYWSTLIGKFWRCCNQTRHPGSKWYTSCCVCEVLSIVARYSNTSVSTAVLDFNLIFYSYFWSNWPIRTQHFRNVKWHREIAEVDVFIAYGLCYTWILLSKLQNICTLLPKFLFLLVYIMLKDEAILQTWCWSFFF